MTGLAKEWHRLLADDGSLVLNIADVWNPGTPTQSLYQEELLLALVRDVGFHLAQRTYWENPSKMPSPAEWVTIRRVRVTPSVEQVYWLSKTAHPKADNRRVLRPYSASMRKRLADGGDVGGTRPSGHARADGAFGRDLGGSIAHNLLTIPNSSSNDAYQRACKAAGLPVHPARWPKELPGFYIAMLTDPGDLVYDPFGGSGQLAAACERLGRRWLSSELMREYVLGSRFRVQDAPGYRPHAPAAHAA
jgi:site-specific DNA-methyltransferase (cytosine-N4-specific)